jgi:dTDP-4-dehydrorhamnose 3,5-epimerase
MFEFTATPLNGCYEITPNILNDDRGRFVKLFQQPEFAKFGLETNYQEEYYSVSHAGVVRGLHFQRPEMDHAKLVCCVSGEVFDVVVDLRLGSPTYAQSYSIELNAIKANCLYIPKGFAHGFAVTSGQATMIYKVSTVYSPEHDDGILWNSLDINWPITNPILSKRDGGFLPLDKFTSPFILK